VIADLVRRLSDPRVTWRVARSFGGWVVKRPVTSTEPQVLSVCDEIICVPVRFSEYFYWSDGQGNPAYRIFPIHDEEWDHVNETNCVTGVGFPGVVGFSGYWLHLRLYYAGRRAYMYIVKRSYPELQVAIFNEYGFTVRVSDPPAVHGLNVYTNGTRGDGYTDIATDQYVVFYRSTLPDLDTYNCAFASSPLGSSKSLDHEIYARGVLLAGYLWFNLYLGIRVPRDTVMYPAIRTDFVHGGSPTTEYNLSGLMLGYPTVEVTYYTGGKSVPYEVVTGWAEDESGSVRFTAIASITYRLTPKNEERARIDSVVLYDADLDEVFKVTSIRPLTDLTLPDEFYPGMCDVADYTITPTVGRTLLPDGSLLEYNYWTATETGFLSTYNASTCYGSDIDACISTAILGAYTDDPGVALPDDLSGAFSFYHRYGMFERLHLTPLSNKTLAAGRTFAIVTRHKLLPPTVTGDEYTAWVLRKKPYRISGTEWKTVLGVLPLTVKLRGVRSGTVSVYVSPPTASPGTTVTVYGTAADLPNKLVRVVLVDPDTYSVVASAQSFTDAYGSYSASLTLPADLAPGKTYRVFVLVEY
jgi:hypothetical protein